MALIGYRFCARSYLESLNQWKAIDEDRSQKHSEIAYMDVFAILITAQTRLQQLNEQIAHGQTFSLSQPPSLLPSY
jgi:hypothetical protein